MTTIRQRLLQALRKAGDKGLSMNELIDIAYEDKGPLDARGVVKQHLYLINRIILKPLELKIVGRIIYRIELRREK